MTLRDALPAALDPKSALEAAFSGELPKTLGLDDQDLVAIAKMAKKALGEGDAPDVERAAWRRKATDALERAIDSGTVDPEFVRASDGLEPLRGDARFEALMERL